MSMRPHEEPAARSPTRRRTVRRAVLKSAAWLATGTALALVFLAYQSPHVAVDLANRVWSCF
ncbi:hypothetical protein [Ideonella margarita]|uniref:Uncharacterized protein n=1 Tax=Ideonella margarita TaxID=2984191 RepID=A0ABU9C9L3_9BURK